MRVEYSATNSTRQGYTHALNSDLGVYHLQSGSGIGGFLAKLLKKAIPIGKSILHKGYELLKPELQKVAVKGIEYAANEGTKLINKKQNAAYKKLGVKRKRDALS